MKRTLIAAAAAALGALAAPAVAAADSQPTQGDHSIDRNEAGVGGGPHCHVLAVEQANGNFTFVRVFPSHKGHLASGGNDGVFLADLGCDGLPG